MQRYLISLYIIFSFVLPQSLFSDTSKNAEIFVESLIKSGKDYVVIYPNNDYGYEEILKKYARIPFKRSEKYLALS